MSSYNYSVNSVFIKQDAATCPRDRFANVPTDGCKYVADIAKCAIDVCHWNVPPTKVRLFLLDSPSEKEESALRRDCLDSRLTLLAANIVCDSSLIAELVKDDPPLARAAEGKSHTRSLPFPSAPTRNCRSLASCNSHYPGASLAHARQFQIVWIWICVRPAGAP